MSSMFENSGLVPLIIDAPPSQLMTIKYGTIEMTPGAEITPLQSRSRPDVISWVADPDKFYTVIMLDPDAISKSLPMFRSVLHWFVGNVPGNDVGKGTEMASYGGPGPPPYTGLHRYVFLAYEQLNGKMEFPASYFYVRPWFSMRKATDKFHLSPQAVAGNFFQSKRM